MPMSDGAWTKFIFFHFFTATIPIQLSPSTFLPSSQTTSSIAMIRRALLYQPRSLASLCPLPTTIRSLQRQLPRGVHVTPISKPVWAGRRWYTGPNNAAKEGDDALKTAPVTEGLKPGDSDGDATVANRTEEQLQANEKEIIDLKVCSISLKTTSRFSRKRVLSLTQRSVANTMAPCHRIDFSAASPISATFKNKQSARFSTSETSPSKSLLAIWSSQWIISTER